jgi:hypothetical protein
VLAKDCIDLIEENFSRPERPKPGHADRDDHKEEAQ